jgi:hypothetical protein
VGRWGGSWKGSAGELEGFLSGPSSQFAEPQSLIPAARRSTRYHRGARLPARLPTVQPPLIRLPAPLPNPRPPARPKNKVIGTVGAGRIGQRVLERLLAFNPKELLYYDYIRLPEHIEKKINARYVPTVEVSRFTCVQRSTAARRDRWQGTAQMLDSNRPVGSQPQRDLRGQAPPPLSHSHGVTQPPNVLWAASKRAFGLAFLLPQFRTPSNRLPSAVCRLHHLLSQTSLMCLLHHSSRTCIAGACQAVRHRDHQLPPAQDHRGHVQQGAHREDEEGLLPGQHRARWVGKLFFQWRGAEPAWPGPLLYCVLGWLVKPAVPTVCCKGDCRQCSECPQLHQYLACLCVRR